MLNKIQSLALILLLVLALAGPAQATIPTTQSTVTLQGNGSTTVFNFPFVADSADDLVVSYTDSTGTITPLSPSTYTVLINPPTSDNLWGIGGNVTYPLSGSPIAAGTMLTIQRVLPLLQTTNIHNQGNFYPDVVESAIDTTLMQVQQVSARGGQFRGVWATDNVYNYGDIAQDGVNGNASGNYYLCIAANISTTWTGDLANGDWLLIITSAFPTTPLPLSIANGGTGQITAPAALTALGGISLSANNTFSGANSFTGGSITVPTRGGGDSTTNAASTNFVTSALSAKAPIANPSFTGTASATLFSGPTLGVTNGSSAGAGQIGEYISSSVARGSAVPLTSTVPANITSIVLTAGDWNVTLNAIFSGNTATTVQNVIASISTVSATPAASDDVNSYTSFFGATPYNSGSVFSIGVPPVRISVTSPTTIYFVVQEQFGVSTASASGIISARRAR